MGTLAGIVALTLFAAADGPAPVASAEDTQREVERDVWVPLLNSSNTFDAEAFLAVQSPELVRVSLDAKEIYGFERYAREIRAGFARARTRGIARTSEARFLERIAADGLAREVGYFRSRARLADGTLRVSYTRFEMTLRRENGRWRILVDQDSSGGGTITEEMYEAATPMHLASEVKPGLTP